MKNNSDSVPKKKAISDLHQSWSNDQLKRLWDEFYSKHPATGSFFVYLLFIAGRCQDAFGVTTKSL